MWSPGVNLVHLFYFFLVAGFAASSSHIASEVLMTQGSIGRSLLQQKTRCPVYFESMNVTSLTSTCQGPNYPVDGCCRPLKTMLCPVKDQINDPNTDCAQVFFFTLSMYSSTPPGLFATLCKEGEHGIRCNDGGEISIAALRAATSSASSNACSPTLGFTLLVGISMILRYLSE